MAFYELGRNEELQFTTDRMEPGENPMAKKARKEIEAGRLAILHNELSTTWEAEVRFHPERRWRFDFADWTSMIAIEVEGGSYRGGRHTSGAGFRADMEKYNAATAMGWRVFRVTPQDFGGEDMFDSVLTLLRNDELKGKKNADNSEG